MPCRGVTIASERDCASPLAMTPRTVLFVHQSGPAQFRHLIRHMHASDEWSPVLLRMKGTRKRGSDGLPDNVPVFEYQPLRSSSSQHDVTADAEAKLIRGESVLAAGRALLQKGMSHPSAIVAHPGWGEALFLKEVFPYSPQLHFCEYYYAAANQDLGFDPEFPITDRDVVKALSKNLNNALSLLQADALYAPTRWQASTYPEPFRSSIEVIHDGVDTAELDAARAAALRPAGERWITYVNRAFEPMRGAHIFCRALPQILASAPDLRVQIIGGEASQRPYSPGASPTAVEQWLKPLLDGPDGHRILHTPYLKRPEYLAALARSSCHVYLTNPFVLSWSLIEAMGLGLPIVASDTAPVRDAIRHQQEGRLVPYPAPEALAAGVCWALEHPAEMAAMAERARLRVAYEFSLQQVCLPRQMQLIESLIRL